MYKIISWSGTGVLFYCEGRAMLNTYSLEELSLQAGLFVLIAALVVVHHWTWISTHIKKAIVNVRAEQETQHGLHANV
jgi:hypothetical protein